MIKLNRYQFRRSKILWMIALAGSVIIGNVQSLFKSILPLQNIMRCLYRACWDDRRVTVTSVSRFK